MTRPMMRLGPDVRLAPAAPDQPVALHYRPRPGMRDLPPLDLHPLVGAVLAYMDRGRTRRDIEVQLAADLHADADVIHEIVGDIEVCFRAHFDHDGGSGDSYVDLDPDALVASVARHGLGKNRSRQILFRGDRAPFPLTMEWVVTRFCNRACVYCYQGAVLSAKAPDSLLSAERVCEILTEARRMGAYNYFITGGEPLLRPDSYDILVHALRLGMKPDIISKQFITAEDADRLAAAGLQTITFSIDSLDPAIAQRMTGIPAFAERITKTVERLVTRGVRVTVRMVLTPINMDSLEPTLDGLQRLGVRFVTIDPYGDNLQRHSDALRVDPHQIQTARAVIDRFQARPDRQMNVMLIHVADEDAHEEHGHGADSFACHVGTTALLFGPDGRVNKCDKPLPGDDFVLGDLREQSVYDIWNSQRMRDAMKPPRELYKGTMCYTCDDFDICHERARCHYDALLTTGTLYGPGSGCPYLETAVKHVC